MNSEHVLQYPLFASLPALSEDEREDACFRGKDLAWSSLVEVYDELAAEGHVTYKSLGDRISRTKSQVQRWIDSPHNMTLGSLSLLAEGLDADLVIKLLRRPEHTLTNSCHPADEACANIGYRVFLESSREEVRPANVNVRSVLHWSN